MAQKIEIPVSLSAQIENLREIRQTLTATLNSAGKDSSLAKTLTKDLSKINQMLGQVEEFALSPTIDESGLKQLQKVLDNFYKQAQSSFSNADFANFEAIASESDIARLKALTTEAAKYRRELEALQKSGSSERTDAYLLRTGKQGLLGKAQAQKGFDSTASLGKNALAMERAAESYQRSADAMQTAIDKLESEANAAITNAQQAAQQVKALEQQKQTLGADTQAARFHHAAGRFKTAIVANRGVENPTINSVERGLRSALESVQANGKIATDARNAVGDWIKHLFPQLPTSDIASMVGQDINTLLSDLMERIFGSGYLDTDVIYSPEHSAILSRAQDYSRSEINRIAGIHSTANVLDLTARSQQVDSDWRKAKSRWTAYNNEADSKVTSWLEMTDQQEELTAAAQATAQLSQELYTLADAAQKAAIASKEAQIQQNAEAQQDLKEGTIRSTRQLAQQGKAASRQYQIAGESFVGELNENLKGVKIDANEAEQFTNNLKQSITHWMSAQQIVNLVKDGIRQAYQDIKNLDAAMTNIAVVTDMSVSDLWGKINEYMSIAQQYGVTTQGVYEVSQLYYQQGLSTNEVMAATTETLKMARIAGMDYAEAADAMTVAIRSFKMEMSDAGHVTDVYSKVAAVTASDSEELAVAMSKTASSAESVGSSFENTTAMLAVMIETTRESAQNLGSALKSIISRYGEMKVGLTVDSEGEDIDYNKVDTALKSIGISIKDAQGQFRDFDDVIFELSAKWDSLDKNTQRYIATIMAGNRQQSRFIALVDNWERLDEVANAAQNSEDAGLLQYAKTLDSLETKINNIKTSFQEFYMSIMNGPFFGAILTFINNLLQGLNQFSTLSSIINIVGIVRGLKSGLTALMGLFSNTFGGIISGWQTTEKRWLNLAIKSGRERGAAERRAYEQGYNTGSAGPTQTNVPGGGSTTSPYGKNYKQRRAEYRQMSWADRRQYGIQNGKVDWKRNSWGRGNVGQGINVGGALVGTVANTAGAALSGAGYHEAGAVTSAFGNVASFASMGAAAGPWGALIGAVVGLAVSVPDLVKTFDANNKLQREYEKAQKEAKEAEVKKAEEVNKYNTLKDLLQQYDKAKSQRGNSDEDYNNWININSKLAEMYPQLISYIDAEGNAIVDVTNRTEILSSAMNNAAKASELYYKAKENEYKAQMAMNANHKYSDHRWDYGASHEVYERLGFRVDRPNGKDVPAKVYTPDGTQVVNVGDWVEFTSETLVDTATQLGVNLDNVLLAAQGVDVKLTELESEWLNFFTSGDGLAKKVFTEKDGVITGWHENIGNYIAGNTGLQQLNSTQQKDLADAVYWKTEASSSDDNLTQMDGANALIASYILSTQKNVKTAQDIRNLTVEEYNNAIASLVDEYGALNLKSREFINDLYNNLNGMSLTDLENAFSEHGIDGKLADTFLSAWYEQNYSRVTRYGNALFQKNAEGNPLEDFEDYSVWSAKEENKGKTKQQYYEAAIAHYRSLGDQIDQSLLDFVINSSDAAVEGYISALERENNIIAGGGMASRAAAGRLGYISQVVQASAEDGTYGELTKAQTDEFIALLGADDAGTQEWAERVREFAKKYNVVIPELESFIYENFTTRMQSLLDGIDDFKKETEDFFAKAEEGFTFDEALKFLKDLDLSEEEFGNIFEIKDGKILLRDFNSAFGMLYDKQFKNLASITSSVNTMVTEIGKDSYEFMDSMRIGHKAEIDNIDSLEERAAMKTDLASDLVHMLGIDTGLADEAADWLIDNVNATDAEFIEWLKSKGVVAEQATEYLEQARTRQLASFSFDNWFKDSYGDKNTLKGLTESPTLEAIKDYAIDNNLVTGVDTDADGLIDSYNWDAYFSTLQGVAIDAFGNMTITDAEAFYLSVTGKTKDMLTAVDWELINLLGSQIDASNEAAIEAFGSIGASAAKGKADYTEVFAKTIAQAGWTEDQFDKEMKKRLSSAASGDATSYGHVKSIIKGEWDKQGRVYTDDELIDATDAFINGYADGQTENAKRFLELSQKQLEGTITQAELKELSEIEIDDQWASNLADVLATKGLSTVQKYGAIVEAAIESGLPWSEIEQTIKEGYSKQLEGFLNEELGLNDAGDTLSAISGMEEAAGHYTNDVLSSIFNQASAETGKAVDLTLFRDYFTFDQETKTWVVKAVKNVNDFLRETYGEDVPEWLIGAFDASEIQKSINNAIKIDDLGRESATTITEMLSDIAEVSLSDLITFYESIYGKGSFNDPAKLQEYQVAIEEAKNGNVEMLTNIVYTLTNAAIATGADVDTGKIAAAVADAKKTILANLIGYISSSIEGALTNTDLLEMATLLDIPDLEKYVFETVNGLSLSTEGMLQAATRMQELYGNVYGFSQQMVELLVGDGKLYNSYKEIDSVIAAIEAKGENITAEEQQQLELLREMSFIAKGISEDATFDFMNQDQTNGLGNTWDTFVDNVNNATNALQALADGEAISVREFQNMMSFMGSQLGPDNALNSIAGGATNAKNALIALYNEGGAASQYLTSLGYDAASLNDLETAADIYTLFTNTIVAQSGRLNEVDAEVLLKFSINAEAMADGMSESLKAVATSQIEYLKNIRQVLVAMKAMEGIGDIKIPFMLTDGDGNTIDKDFELPKAIEELLDGDNTVVIDGVTYTFDKEKVLADVVTRLRGALPENVFDNIFPDGVDLSDPVHASILKGLSKIDYNSLTEDQLLYIGEQIAAQTQGLEVGSPEYQAAVLKALALFFDRNLEEIPSMVIPERDKAINDMVRALFTNNELVIPADSGDITLKLDSETGNFKVDPTELGDDAKNMELAAEIRKYLLEKGIINNNEEVVIDTNGNITYHVVNPTVRTIVDNLGDKAGAYNPKNNSYTITDVTELHGEATYTLNATTGALVDSNGDPIPASQLSPELQAQLEAQGYEKVELGNTGEYTYTLTPTVEGESLSELAQIKQSIDLIYGLFSSGQVLSLSFDNTSAEATQTVLDAILAAWDTLIKLDGSTVTLNVNQGGNAGPQIPAGAEDANQAKGGVAVPLTIDKANFISQLTTLYTSITNNTDGIEPPVIKVIAEWQEGSPINLEAEIKAQTFIQDVQLNYTNKDGYKQTGLVQNVRLNYIHGPIGLIAAKGNVALANGNISNLLAGAALAQGTLMGELGPELYVQGGQYHIAGANGPEFVDLDRDAIVFNHLQTASLLGKGHATTTGSPVTSERRAVGAYATGNVSGPAMAGGIDSAIAAIDSAIAMWQNILNATAADLLGASGGGGGGGGSGESIKAVTEELQEWYNLSRQIADIEQEINNLLAERANIEQSNGEEYLRNLRKQQQLLEQQITTQQVLVQYQELQLKRQAELINQNAIWSQFLFVNASGLLQYVSGNEANGGKGALQVLQELNQMSGEQQTAFLQNLGYSYTTVDGVALEGSELVEQFFQELQDQIDQYDSLYDTVHESLSILEELETQINDINQEIKENQLELEQAIYDIIVKAWEKEIEQMEKQADVIKEANEAYIESLNEAISEERKLYDENRSIADREQLQRQLSLLRRSGGSAAEIANLETQLDDMLKEEYFNNQEKMIENIEKANEKQIQQLEEQIKIQEEMLEYQKENGVIWTEVYQVMSQSKEAMISFMQGNSPDFFSQSALQQEQMLTEWAHKIGIYNENKNYENYRDYANDNVWNNGAVWNLPGMNALKGIYNSLTAEQQQLIKDQFANAYANARLAGDNNDAAIEKARQAIMSTLTGYQGSQNAGNNQVPTTPSGPAPDTGSSGSGEETATRYKSTYTITYTNPETGETAKYTGSGVGSTAAEAEANARYWLNKRMGGEAPSQYSGWNPSSPSGPAKAKPYLHGGLVDYTGIALVHGSKSRPESFLNADQTQQIQNALKMSGDGGALDSIRDTLSMLNNTIKSIVKTNTYETTTFTVAPGAVTIQVAQLNDAYDVEELSRDVMNRMVDIANKATNRGVSRR